MKYIQPITILVLVGIVIFMALQPKENEHPYYLQHIDESIERQDSLVDLIDYLKTPRYEIKDSMFSVDSVYVDISKEQLRARVRHDMFRNRNR